MQVVSESVVSSEETPQQRFNRIYISSVEIMDLLQVSRTAISQARKRGLLPCAIMSHNGSMILWERAVLQPNLEAWKLMLSVRRANAA